MHRFSPQLLVSVRNATEAQAASAGGADLIDIKEPARGSLGRADSAVIGQIVEQISGRLPVSVALGELQEIDGPENLSFIDQARNQIDYVKIGLAGQAADDLGRWRQRLREVYAGCEPARAIAVAYADHQLVEAPPVEKVIEWACENAAAGLLIDTAIKDGSDLFDHIDPKALGEIVGQVRRAGLMIALAGSLHGQSLEEAASLEPNIVAVRGAACVGRNRNAGVDRKRIEQIKMSLQTSTVGSIASS